jgi:adenosylhomocysteine nucleosidase
LLALIAAEAREFDGLLRHAERVSRLDWPLGFARSAWLNGREVVLVANGPGPKLAGQAADIVRQKTNVTAIASIGFCGALDPSLKPCDIFVATDVAHALSVPRSHSCERLPGLSTRPHQTGKLLSLDRVISTASEKAELHRTTGAAAVEMEAAAIAQRASEWNIPFYAIRVVTDTASESFPLDFNRLRDPEGRFSRTKILAAALSRPTATLPALLHLNQRCKLASRALGDFLADTRF